MEKPKKIKEDSNGQTDVSALVATMNAQNKLVGEALGRIEELESRQNSGGLAQLYIAQRLLDTDRKHLPEMTRLSLRSVRPNTLADMSAAILSAEVQMGEVTLSQIRRESYYRHMRSVGGNLQDKAAELAMEQIKVEEQQGQFDQGDLGKGL